ncbi:MAG: imidazole glycerol phosphate synthase subunit HisH [Thermoanaerobaculia bacterium]|nr:imidazole glycerol phosphate synthase subunit HisH [Thermoanaerobaculia bacterium]
MTIAAPAGASITVLDIGVGNLGNVERALRAVGAEVTVTDEPRVVESSRCLLLPGVGAFGPARRQLAGDLESALRSALGDGAWLLGICVGYQLLFEGSEEDGPTDGLGLLPGIIRHLRTTQPAVQVPHIGWNRLSRRQDHPLLAGVTDGDAVYYVHSYAPAEVPFSVELASTRHGSWFPAVAGRGRVCGAQFHPEKSGPIGLRLLANFLEMSHGPTSGD